MFTKIHIKQFETGLLFKRGELVDVLHPGQHRIFGFNLRTETYDRLQTCFVHAELERLVRLPTMAAELEVVDLKENERAVVWREGRLFAVLRPGINAFWKTPAELTIERFDTDVIEFKHAQLSKIIEWPQARALLTIVDVKAHEEAMLFRDGELIAQRKPGRYAFWRQGGELQTIVVDLREQVLDIQGQEIMTSDKVTLRINLLVTFRVVMALKAVTQVADFNQSLYREAQLALRAAVGTRSLEHLLADKESIGGVVANALKARATEFGLDVTSTGVRDIILPGDMKALLNQVTEAQKAAEANIIKRREETAAARSQANTARLLADSPTLMKMRELEALQDIMKGVKATFIFAGGDVNSQLKELLTTSIKET